MEKRRRAARDARDKLASNPNMFVSPVRLSVRNLDRGVGRKELKVSSCQPPSLPTWPLSNPFSLISDDLLHQALFARAAREGMGMVARAGNALVCDGDMDAAFLRSPAPGPGQKQVRAPLTPRPLPM